MAKDHDDAKDDADQGGAKVCPNCNGRGCHDCGGKGVRYFIEGEPAKRRLDRKPRTSPKW